METCVFRFSILDGQKNFYDIEFYLFSIELSRAVKTPNT